MHTATALVGASQIGSAHQDTCAAAKPAEDSGTTL